MVVRDRILNLKDLRRPGTRFSFLLEADVVRIDRKSKWGNPFPIGTVTDSHEATVLSKYLGRAVYVPMDVTREDALLAYRNWLSERLKIEPDFLEELRQKRLACWCRPLPCHGDIMIELGGL